MDASQTPWHVDPHTGETRRLPKRDPVRQPTDLLDEPHTILNRTLVTRSGRTWEPRKRWPPELRDISSDGRMAWTWERHGPGAYVSSAQEPTLRRVASPASCLGWRDDGRLCFLDSKRPRAPGSTLACIDPDHPKNREIVHRARGMHYAMWHSSGSVAWFTSDGSLWTLPAGGRPGRVQWTGSQYLHGSWSPDGTRLAFMASLDEEGNKLALVVVDADRTVRTLARWSIRGMGLGSLPTWSPDGAYVAYALNPLGMRDPTDIPVFVVPTSGGPPRRIATIPQARGFIMVAWFPEQGRAAR